jgi:hypothetical protein
VQLLAAHIVESDGVEESDAAGVCCVSATHAHPERGGLHPDHATSHGHQESHAVLVDAFEGVYIGVL